MFTTNKAVILAKIEATYNVDPVPTAALNAILCSAPEVDIIGKRLERENTKAVYGARLGINIGEGISIKFVTELKGSGTAGTAPEGGVLFRACNLTETIVASTSVTYDPNSNADTGESITIYFYRHNILHKVSGCRGSFNAELKSGEYGKINWTFQGIYQGPSDGTIPAGTYNATIPPRFISAAFAIDSYAAIIESLKVDVANEIARRPSANAATGILEYFIKERMVKGECDPEVVSLATKNFWTMWSDSSVVALTALVGSAAGNKCTITAPKVQLDMLKYGDREGIVTYAMPLIFTPNAGNDEVRFAYT
jgi:hypothetical protein